MYMCDYIYNYDMMTSQTFGHQPLKFARSRSRLSQYQSRRRAMARRLAISTGSVDPCWIQWDLMGLIYGIDIWD